MEADKSAQSVKQTAHAKKKVPLVPIIVAAVVIVAVIVMLASHSSSTNPLSSALHVGPIFKDLNKSYTGAASFSSSASQAATAAYDNCQQKVDYGLSGPDNCKQASTYGSESVTLVKVIDPATGINNVDVAAPGYRFVTVEFRQKNDSSTPLQDGVIGAWGALPTIVGSDGQTYQAGYGTRTTPGCPAFPVSDNNGLPAGQSLIGCYRYTLPASVKIEHFSFSFANPDPTTMSAGATVTWKRQ